MLLKLLKRYQAERRKCLVFSQVRILKIFRTASPQSDIALQFTQVLDILQVILKQRNIKFLVLTGSTPVDVRQGLVDEFTEDTNMSIPVFLLSTKAGGMGINLTAASVVIMFDQDFNPHNDKQAADRAYRIGQKRDVEIVKLITKGTIEEDVMRLGETKLALDEAVAGEAAGANADSESSGKSKKESAPEKIMRESLVETLRKQFKEEDRSGSIEADGSLDQKDEDDVEMRDAGPSEETIGKGKTGGRKNTTKSKSTKVISLDSDSDLTDID